MTNDSKLETLSFEDALQKLEGIVTQIERGDIKLDEAITSYEEGVNLKNHCSKKLKEAQMKVEKLIQSDGNIKTENITETL